MVKKRCTHIDCKKVIIGVNKKQVDYLMAQHMLTHVKKLNLPREDKNEGK